MRGRRGYARPTTPVFSAIAGLLMLLVMAVTHVALTGTSQSTRIQATAELVQRVGLTDLALFTEARYTRHPALADLHTPFQDDPMSFEHFPSGTFMPVPARFGKGVFDVQSRETRP
jgi:hypothetical protein